MKDTGLVNMGRQPPPESWRWCRECASVTGGRCGAHAIWVEVIPAIIIPASTIVAIDLSPWRTS